jgi:natural product biosynthesis luciferase-like monooxygenase protein
MFSCILIGNEALLVQCGILLRDKGFAITAVVSSNDAAKDWATQQSIPVIEWGDDLEKAVGHLDYDWLFSIANLRMIPQPVWQKARRGAINFHDGPLPRLAGLNAPTWAILEGETTFGVTWHEITEGADEGKIYSQTHFDINPDEISLTLNTKCLAAGVETFAKLVDDINNNTLTGVAQDFSQRSYFAKSKRPDAAGTLPFEKSAEDLSRLHRALNFGAGYTNRMVHPKIRHADGIFLLTTFTVLGLPDDPKPAGFIRSVGSDGVVVATATDDVLINGTMQRNGHEVLLSDHVRQGDSLPQFATADLEDLNTAVADVVRYEDRAKARLLAAEDVKLFDVSESPSHAAGVASISINLPDALTTNLRVAVIAAFLARFSGQDRLDIAYCSPKAADYSSRFPGYFAPNVPLHVELPSDFLVSEFAEGLASQLTVLRREATYLSDLHFREPGLSNNRLTTCIVETDNGSPRSGSIDHPLTFVLDTVTASARLAYDQSRVPDAIAAQYCRHIELLASAFLQDGRVVDLPLMSADEIKNVVYGWNDTARDYDRNACVHTLIEQQVQSTPNAIAVAWRNEELTYKELNDRANLIANVLVDLGVKPDFMVGLNLPRCSNLVVGALAIQKAGGAYVPLDPHFPADRLAYMVEDSGAAVILTSRMTETPLFATGVKTVFIEDILERSVTTDRPVTEVSPSNLAYVIYTSGSTGRPKGVMVEHRNVVNFFAGMDERIQYDKSSQPVWLAVTSLSFDISVLELFWTLARGFKVVLHSAQTQSHKGGDGAVKSTRAGKAPIDFGLFYWGNDDGAGPAKYQLLLEGAKFADANGFQAIWTPERHFHAFGGPYPNPAVTGAAIAAVTKNLAIRAGSCVLPLHHPIRVVEEWAVLDNLSNGRVGLAFASGWMPEDFVLRPENAPPHNKTALLRDIETVRKLWRGERMEFDYGGGKASVVTQPRPVQPEVPVWLTTAGNPETYREAARNGAHVLTHLLGQSVDELAEKISIYRQTLIECGRNPDAYKVTLMLHTLLGEDREEVRDAARGPMKAYLQSATALIKQYAWAFPAFKKPQGLSNALDIDLQSLAADELDAILEFAFLRYFEDSGLFGTVDDAMKRIDQVAGIGVDEIACLIDFGVPSELVLERLEPLARVVAQARAETTVTVEDVANDNSFDQDVHRHGVTHLQCTPSMARMFLINETDRAAFAQIRHLFIGGEALQNSLLGDIQKLTNASVENMYGPTETTIWSSTMTADMSEIVVPLGQPIANTQLYVLDASGGVAAPGQPGELYIGGDGVTRGYLNREELTRERFLPNPFAPGRIYRTGDLVCRKTDGTLRFLGRTDYQVKVRGYRIELGEIEARIGSFPGVAEAVVVAREDRASDVRIVAYLRLTGQPLNEEALRQHLGEALPDYMIPAHFVTLKAFPLTPNAKVDRKALPKPDTGPIIVSAQVFVAPENKLQSDLAEAYSRTLGIDRVGLNDNFFALGGHSLLAVQLHRDLKVVIAPDLTITDVFRFPTVRALAEHLADRGKAEERLSQVADRAANRRAALGDRRAALTRSRL